MLNTLSHSSITTEQLENFINPNFQEIYDFFYNQTHTDLYTYKSEIKGYFKQAKNQIISLDCSNKINGDFIALMIDSCEKLHLLMEFKLFYDYLYKSDYKLGNRLKATYSYHGIQRFDNYYDKYPIFLDLLQISYNQEEELKEKLTATFINFYLTIVYDFGERNKEKVLKLKNTIYIAYKEKEDNFLDEKFINIIFSINIDDYKKAYNESLQILNEYLYNNRLIINSSKKLIKIEAGCYSKTLKEIKNPTFKKIRNISVDYIMNIGNPNELHKQLNQGVTIIEKENLLYEYLFSYGKMHKAKLYSSFDTVIHKLENEIINIIDWGCGQALATSLLIDYIKEKKLNIIISNITLIEPSSMALSRGMLHIEVLKDSEIDIKAVNKDIDRLEESDLTIDNDNITLHLFSNILDVEFFRLDKGFLQKTYNSQKKSNYFICVSPNINDKRNARLDIFYRYFDDNYETELISARDSDIESYKRYEKVFKTQIK